MNPFSAFYVERAQALRGFVRSLVPTWSTDLLNWFGTGVIHNVLSDDRLVTTTRSRTNVNGAPAKFLRLRAQRTAP